MWTLFSKDAELTDSDTQEIEDLIFAGECLGPLISMQPDGSVVAGHWHIKGYKGNEALVTVCVLLGAKAVDDFEENRKLNLDDAGDGHLKIRTFPSEAEINAYIAGLNDLLGWENYKVVSTEVPETLRKWFGGLDFRELERITKLCQFDYDPEDGYDQFVIACHEWWDELPLAEKVMVYGENHELGQDN